MRYVNPSTVFDLFCKYLDDYDHDMISKETAIEELQDALDSADYEEIDE